MFKKKSLKFTYEKVSRDLRHAETLKARESSRFKRLSMIRSINDSDFLEKGMETSKEKEVKVPEKKKPSRLEMLFKWKQEKQIKKEMEKQAKKKPFYVGGKKEVTENKALLSFKSSSSFNSTKSFNSKLVTPTTSTIQSSRIFNSKQGIPSSSIQSRLPNTKQITPSTTSQSSKILSSKQPALPKSGSNLLGSNSSATTSKKFPPSASVVHKTALPKSNLCRSNSTATLSKKVPTLVADRTGSSLKYGNSLTRSSSTASIPRKFPVPSSTISKIANSKSVTQKVPFVNKASCNPPKRAESHDSKSATIKSKSVTKPINKVSTEQKSVPKQLEEKSVKKTGTVLPKVTINATVSSRGTPVQSKETLQRKDKESLRKGYCFRTAISNSMRQQTGNLLKTPLQGTPKKIQEKISKNVKPKTVDEISEQSVDSIPDVTFNSDISIIKPARTSFAPANFTFQPPENLNNFIFEDEDFDVYQALEEVSKRFMSRTSTPSKDSGRKSSVQSSKESLSSNNNIAAIEKTSNTSNSNDICISELMSPESYHIKVDNNGANNLPNGETAKQICDEINNGIKNVKSYSVANQNICKVNNEIKDLESEGVANQDICEINSEIKDVESGGAANQDMCEVLNSVSSMKIKADDVNEEMCKELTTISPVKAETDIVVKEKSFKKHAFVSPLKIETDDDIKNESYQKIASPVKVENNLKEETCQKPSISPVNIKVKSYKTIHLDDDDDDGDDSLLDSIDLNKIQLMNSDDEDSSEDYVASPQILKCSERKSNGTIPKRVSMLRKLSIMNSIAETSETDECIFVNSTKSAKKNQDSKCTPRRSKRLSNHQPLDALNNSPAKSNAQNPSGTPRRSLRLMKHTENSNNFPVSPFQEKNSSNVRRHSVRLIDLNTPEKAACEKLLGENFENLDPNAFLIDFESPTTPTLSKSKKVSLLYSPEKRKSMRKSIRGDLISFSPV